MECRQLRHPRLGRVFHLNASQLYLFNLIERMVLVVSYSWLRGHLLTTITRIFCTVATVLVSSLSRSLFLSLIDLLPALLRSIIDNVRQGFAEDSRGTVRSPISTRIVTLHEGSCPCTVQPLLRTSCVYLFRHLHCHKTPETLILNLECSRVSRPFNLAQPWGASDAISYAELLSYLFYCHVSLRVFRAFGSLASSRPCQSWTCPSLLGPFLIVAPAVPLTALARSFRLSNLLFQIVLVGFPYYPFLVSLVELGGTAPPSFSPTSQFLLDHFPASTRVESNSAPSA